MTEQGGTKFWLIQELEGMEMLHSSGIDPAHSRHMHESFAIGIVDDGVVVNQSRGEATYLPAGSVFTFNPGEVHSGYAADALAVSHRSFYPSEQGVSNFARDLRLRGTPFCGSERPLPHPHVSQGRRRAAPQLPDPQTYRARQAAVARR